MRYLSLAFIACFLFSAPVWKTDFEKAKQQARAEHKSILLNFSGSDWCGPCIRLRKEIFESSAFDQYAGEHLVLVNADFPRVKKHQLSRDQQQKNDELAEIYNKDGIFPLTLLLTEDGKILKKWEGFPGGSAEAFTNQIKAVIDAGR